MIEQPNKIDIQKTIREVVEKYGPEAARKWGEELREDREALKEKEKESNKDLNIHKLVMEKLKKDGKQIAKEWNDEYERNRALLLKKRESLNQLKESFERSEG